MNAAQEAFPSWSETPFEARCQLLKDYAETLHAHEKDFTMLIMRETRKSHDMASRETLSSYDIITGTTTFTLPEEKIEDDTKTAVTR